jgi:hypothetical protein
MVEGEERVAQNVKVKEAYRDAAVHSTVAANDCTARMAAKSQEFRNGGSEKRGDLIYATWRLRPHA